MEALSLPLLGKDPRRDLQQLQELAFGGRAFCACAREIQQRLMSEHDPFERPFQSYPTTKERVKWLREAILVR